LADGNVGGEELSWTSSVKTSSYRFPGIELKKGDLIVLHLAPEGVDEERDELGADLASSGGVDSSASGRDLWCGLAPLPDESGALSLALRPGGPPIDGFFYADVGKTGALAEDRLAAMAAALCTAGAWPQAGSKPAWEDAFRWKSSPARSICRRGEGQGPAAWYATAAGAQSPGSANAGPDSGEAAKGLGKKLSRKTGSKKP
jgi:hypothetical protein